MAHKTVTVLPRDDGQDFQESWMVHINNRMKSNHTTKEAAKNAAREYANDGDTLEIRRQNGTVQKRVTVRKASADRDEREAAGVFNAYGERTFEIGISDAFR